MNRTLFIVLTCALGLFLAACGASNAPTPAPTPLPPTNAPTLAPSPLPPTNAPPLMNAGQAQTNANATACATENHAPSNAFRSDAAAKLTASTKPKLLEFWAVW